ncbi:MAG: glycoside hydrolase family 44 protein [Fimbriimonas sp.]
MSFVSALLLVGVAQTRPILVTTDVRGPFRLISPYVYGYNDGDWNGRHRYLTLARKGGNRMTAYNWENNASNAGSDWNHQNDSYLGGGDIPGEAYRAEMETALNGGKAFLVTIPLVDYVAADKNGDGDVAWTPNYLQVRFKQNRAKKGSAFAYPPNTGDAFVYQDEFVSWLEQKFANRTRPIFYCLDNEPDLWQETHARIHPDNPGYQELWDRSKGMSNAIKDVVPNATVFGPVSYGFSGYVRLQNAPDHNNRDFLDWYMQQNRAHQLATGRRLIDVMDLHWYPEAYGDGQRVIVAGSSAGLVQARIQAPRSLWDPTYRENSWIANDWYNAPIRLIPRLKQSIAANDPEMKLAFTEYYYGGGGHISGGIAQADVLGVFGREGVFAANLWRMQAENSFIDAAFDAFRNYDGRGSTFGDLSLNTTTSNVAEVTAYTSKFSNGRPGTVSVVINKAGASRNVELWLKGGRFSTVSTYSLTSAAAGMRPNRIGTKQGEKVVLKLPAMSVNVVVAK